MGVHCVSTRQQAAWLHAYLNLRRDRGFTLIELLVVIVVIGVLSAIALPSFLNQANKAKQVEAKTYIGTMNRAQQAYYTERLQFSSDIGSLGLSMQTQTYNYRYEIALAAGEGGVRAFHYADSLGSQLKSYVGMAALVELTTAEFTTQTIMCEAKTPGAVRAANPSINLSDLNCAASTEQVK